ncbi:putative carbamoyl-phosphate-synthetase [Dehalobacter sp. DCA]|jgi:Biotin carboxylase|uniref:ATP-grasp domain-containing protein n=1 Tax=Dehalobacter sp. DCA TaxID=1147129 RepID=UPI00028B6AD0|nr:ATP-grasp domain-containing protein [Dehalobacter sp. DCA]AFV02089.1 putative carbamoyl-phosphate-synthetase [Dehalobacter sp. DCA]
MVKKILMLGGSYFQVPSIKAARNMGYYVVSCDYIPENPGHKFADEYHNVSTTDKEAVLNLAKRLKIDGIVCYASDPAAITAAYVAEKMGFPTNPYESVEVLSNKDLFRNFLAENGFKTPKAKGYTSINKAIEDIHSFTLPVMIKPVDSSGSKGVSRVFEVSELEEKAIYALSFSRAKRFIMEEYTEKYGYQVAGDGFSVNGQLVFRCFANEHFESDSSNPYVPIGESWPYNMPQRLHDKIHCEVQRLLTLLDMKDGAYNFDIRIDRNENIYLMEVGPRNGGNLIPQVIKYATGVDLTDYTIKTAMGVNCSDLKMVETKGYWSSYMVHCSQSGVLQDIWVDENLRKNIVEFNMQYRSGDQISAFTGSNGTLGTMILKYESLEEMLRKMNSMDQYVKVKVKVK